MTIRPFLDRLYLASGILAAICLVAILCVIVMQMVARWSLISLPGLSEYAGYLMAASSFLAFAYALNSGSHIRVSLILSALGRHRYWAELWCMVIGTVAASYLAWYAIKAIYWSLKFGDISQGLDATPIWIVQIPVGIGAVLLAVSFWDNLISLLLYGRDNIRAEKLDGPEV
ncbi:TRAP transporter small permease [Salaquimonas pukyongi]|uniref:TRAP transporter small permease n=1 Tax=Salaquimonas pukyongi TaxID=2712698 RepID=UPI00096B86DB|nr:TRAP transporter small permease [Salaquimonas pukyongi]